MTEFEKLCEMDDGKPEAAHKLALCYINGVGVERDLLEAKKYLKYAAHMGYSESEKLLETLSENRNNKAIEKRTLDELYYSERINEDPSMQEECLEYILEHELHSKASALIEKINAGGPSVRGKLVYLLGACYEKGIGVPQDKNTALRYYINSADCGDYPPAFKKYADMLEQGTGVKANKKLSVFFRK